METVVAVIMMIAITSFTALGLFYVYVESIEEHDRIGTMIMSDLNVIKRSGGVTVHLTLENLGPGPIEHIIINDLTIGDFRMHQTSDNESNEISDSFGQLIFDLPAGNQVIVPTDPTANLPDRIVGAGDGIPAGNTNVEIKLRHSGNSFPIHWPDATVDSTHENKMIAGGEDLFVSGSKIEFWLDIRDGNNAGGSGTWLQGSSDVGTEASIQFAYITNNILRITDYSGTTIKE